jgi:threonine dehydratase
MPDGVNPSKLAAVEALGASVELFGTTTSEGQGRARELAESKGWMLVDDFADPYIIAGAGTVALEILEDYPEIDVLIVPVGGGALAGGCGVVSKALRPATKVIGVCPSSCPATGLSWERGEAVEAECHTMADGLAVSRPDQRTVDLIRRVVDEIVFVDEAGLLEAMRLLLRLTNTLAEPSGAAALAGLLQLGEIGGGDVGIVVSGANIAPPLLPQLLDPGQTIRP